jgi:TAG lipase/lysophosphatidylethanolamine acyltransferase
LGDANTLELSFFPNHGSTWKSLSAKFRRFLTEGVPLDIEVLAKCVRANVGDVTFQEAYDKYGRIINITVTPTNNQNQPLLLNFLTSPNVLLWLVLLFCCFSQLQ